MTLLIAHDDTQSGSAASSADQSLQVLSFFIITLFPWILFISSTTIVSCHFSFLKKKTSDGYKKEKNGEVKFPFCLAVCCPCYGDRLLRIPSMLRVRLCHNYRGCTTRYCTQLEFSSRTFCTFFSFLRGSLCISSFIFLSLVETNIVRLGCW